MSPLPGCKCPKWFKLSLGELWESKGSYNSDIDIDEIVLHKEITQIRKNHAETEPNFNNETEQ